MGSPNAKSIKTFSVFPRSLAAEALENPIEISDAAKSAFVANLGDVVFFLRQQTAGFFKSEKIDKDLEVHTEAIIEKG